MDWRRAKIKARKYKRRKILSPTNLVATESNFRHFLPTKKFGSNNSSLVTDEFSSFQIFKVFGDCYDRQCPNLPKIKKIRLNKILEKKSGKSVGRKKISPQKNYSVKKIVTDQNFSHFLQK